MEVRRLGRERILGVLGFLRFLASTIVAAMLGLATGLPVLAMGLVVPVQVVGPLALVVGGLSAGLGAAWVANLFARDRSRLLLVAGVAEASAVLLALLMLVSFLLPVPGLDSLFVGPLIYVAGVCAAIVAVNAGVAAVRLRGTRGRLGLDGAAAILLSGFCSLLGLSVGGAGLLPMVPDWGLVRLGYENLVWISLVFLAVGVAMTFLRSRRPSPGHELGHDAATTLALVAAMLPVVVGSISFACSNLVGCGA